MPQEAQAEPPQEREPQHSVLDAAHRIQRELQALISADEGQGQNLEKAQEKVQKQAQELHEAKEANKLVLQRATEIEAKEREWERAVSRAQ